MTNALISRPYTVNSRGEQDRLRSAIKGDRCEPGNKYGVAGIKPATLGISGKNNEHSPGRNHSPLPPTISNPKQPGPRPTFGILRDPRKRCGRLTFSRGGTVVPTSGEGVHGTEGSRVCNRGQKIDRIARISMEAARKKEQHGERRSEGFAEDRESE